jgi:HEAT repeat protein
LCIALFAFALAGAYGQEPESQAQRREATLRYGIETQVIELIGALRAEKDQDYDELILELLANSNSPRLRVAILEYFAALPSDKAEALAARFIEERDSYQEALVLSSFSYLSTLKSRLALPAAFAILSDEEQRYMQAAVKMIGASADESSADELLAAYEADEAGAALKQAIIVALGDIRAAGALPLLSRIVEDEASGKVERMYAATALGRIGDKASVAVLERASVSNDPNVRASAVEALGGFDSANARAALVNALRDAHVLPRAAAARGIAKLGVEDAVPALEFKVAYDPERSVREASIDALAAIGNKRAWDFLVGYAEDAKSPSQYRVKAFTVLIAKGGSAQRDDMLKLFLANGAEKDRPFYLALARAFLLIDEDSASAFVEKLYADKDFSVRLSAIAWAERNRYKAHLAELKRIAEADATEAVKKRALSAVERIERD